MNNDGRGPAWSNSLFEDNAEFGLGFRLAVDSPASGSRRTCSERWPARSATTWSKALLEADQSDEAGIAAQRERVAALRAKLATVADARRHGGST